MGPKKQKVLLHQLAVLTHLTMQTLDDLMVLPQAKETAKEVLEPALKYSEDILNTIFDATDDDYLENMAYLSDLTSKVQTVRGNYNQRLV